MDLPQVSKSGSLIELSFRRLYQKCLNNIQNSEFIDSIAKDPKFHAQVEKLQELIADMQRGSSMRIDDSIIKQYKQGVKQLASYIKPSEVPGFMKTNKPEKKTDQQAPTSNGNVNNNKQDNGNKNNLSTDVLREELGLRHRGGEDSDVNMNRSESHNHGNASTIQESLQQDLIENLGDLVQNLKTNVTQVNTHITQRGKLLDETHHKLDANVDRAKQAKQTATTINVQTSMGLCQRIKLILVMLFVLGLMTMFMVSNKVLRRVLWLK